MTAWRDSGSFYISAKFPLEFLMVQRKQVYIIPHSKTMIVQLTTYLFSDPQVLPKSLSDTRTLKSMRRSHYCDI